MISTETELQKLSKLALPGPIKVNILCQEDGSFYPKVFSSASEWGEWGFGGVKQILMSFIVNIIRKDPMFLWMCSIGAMFLTTWLVHTILTSCAFTLLHLHLGKLDKFIRPLVRLWIMADICVCFSSSSCNDAIDSSFSLIVCSCCWQTISNDAI